jgi:hypothetical protein
MKKQYTNSSEAKINRPNLVFRFIKTKAFPNEKAFYVSRMAFGEPMLNSTFILWHQKPTEDLLLYRQYIRYQHSILVVLQLHQQHVVLRRLVADA